MAKPHTIYRDIQIASEVVTHNNCEFYGPTNIDVIDNYIVNILSMVVYSCKKCGEFNYLTLHTFWNLTDFGAKCEKCETINTISLENGELKKQV